MAPRRTAFILGSLLIHAGLGAGVFVSQIWGIERLDVSLRSSPGLAVIMPPPPAQSGAPALPDVKVEKKQKKVVKETVQPTVIEDAPAKPSEVPAVITGTGDGSGSGPGSGSGDTPGECLVDCGPGGGSSSAPPKDPPKPVVEQDTFVPPNVLTMMRISGNTQIHPDNVTKTAMDHDGRRQTTGVAKVCVSELGQVTSVTMLSSTKYPAYDAQLIAGVKTWTYKPYAAKGRNVKVCGTVTFVYGMK